jgi:hypothetical protein
MQSRTEVERGFSARGLYRKRLGYFVDGMVVGTEEFIRSQLTMMREAGLYQRRKNPIIQLNGYTSRCGSNEAPRLSFKEPQAPTIGRVFPMEGDAGLSECGGAYAWAGVNHCPQYCCPQYCPMEWIGPLP